MIYNAMLEYIASIDENPDDVEEELKQHRLGKKKAKDPNTRTNQGGAKVVRQKVPVKVGDVVYVKSKKAYGIVKDIVVDPKSTDPARNKQVKVEIDDELTRKRMGVSDDMSRKADQVLGT